MDCAVGPIARQRTLGLGPDFRRDEWSVWGEVYTPANLSNASPVIRRTIHSFIAAAPRLS